MTPETTPKAARAGELFLALVRLMTLFGIPAAGWVALVLFVQVPRFIYRQADPLLFAGEIVALLTVVVLVLILRACLRQPSAPAGFYRNVLDFLALSRWHPSVIVALIALVVLPPAWYFNHNYWAIVALWERGRAALRSVDVQHDLDSVAVAYQLGLTGGVPLLFCLHMLSRSKPSWRILPWVLIPLLLLGSAVGAMIVATILHQPS